MSDKEPKPDEPIRIKKYANRRLYNTATSTYVTLDDLAEMVKQGSDFVVNDAKSGEDITHQVLTQIIFEQENKGENLLPIPFLRQLIRFYGDSMQGVVPSFLELSLDQLAGEQNKFRDQMAETFGANPMGLMEEQVRQNLNMFNDAMKMFTPIAPHSGAADTAGTSAPKADAGNSVPEPAKKTGNDLSVLQDQLSAMQAQINKLSDEKKG